MLTWNDVCDVMKILTSHDRRTVGEGDIKWWLAQANYGEWPSVEFVVAAIIKHAADYPDVYLNPGHITGYWREVKRDANRRFIPPVPTRENVDDLEAQQRATHEAHELFLLSATEQFIIPMRGSVTSLQKRLQGPRQ